MWLVLESEPDAFLYVGFNRDVTREEVRRRVADGTIETVLHKMLTHAGDVVFIPAGTVHAIGAGNLILEIQQSSNATYRLFDFNRRDAQGKLRPLHLEKALDVLDCKQYSAPSDGEQTFETDEIARYKYFKVFLHDVNGSFNVPIPSDSFVSMVCIGGEGNLKRDGMQTALRYGDSVYLPAGGSSAQLEGCIKIVVCYANV
jgi:mannose-6-phosphate isomerase